MRDYWGALYAQHSAALVNYLAKLTGDVEVAGELTHETFIRAMSAGHDTELREPRAWLFQIAGNLARDHFRRQRLVRFLPFTSRETSTAWLDDDSRLVHEALSRISTTLATTLLLHYDVGFSRREIARMHGVTEEAVKSRLARGREAFARAFVEIGGNFE